MMYFVITSLVLLSSCVFKGYKQDALLEEIAEEVLEAHIGVDVDFTPQSKE